MLTAKSSTSQVNVEKKLDDFLEEFRGGKRRDSIISRQTVESLSIHEKETWRTIRKELEDIGITVADFDANKAFIYEWFTKSLASGAFKEQLLDGHSDIESDMESLHEKFEGIYFTVFSFHYSFSY
jgi:hypothetical protein